MPDSDHIISLTISNVKKITAAKITLDENQRIVIISGENGAGKSSVLDSIEMALAGKSTIPSKPVRDGKETARIVLETEKLIITRTFAGGNNYLKCENKEGFRTSSPQTLLDSMIALIGFDPLQFANMKSTDQGQQLLKIFPTKINLAENANYQKGTYQERTDVNRDHKNLVAQIGSIPVFPDALPTIEVSVSALSQRSVELREELNEIHKLQQQFRAEQHQAVLDKKNVDIIEESIVKLHVQLKQAKKFLANREAKVKALQEKEVRPTADIEKEIDSIDKGIQSAETVNATIRLKADIEKKKIAAKALEDKSAELTAKLEKLEKQRSDALHEAKFPVEGLSIDVNGNVILNGVPFDQASTAQKLIVGIAIAAASPNKLRVCLIRDGSLLDSKSMKVVAEMAAAKDIQIWMERVEDSSPVAVQIVDGSNIGATDAPEVEAPEEKSKATPSSAAAPSGEFSLAGAVAAKKTRKKADNVDPFKA